MAESGGGDTGVKLKWLFETGSGVRSSPALSSDGATVYVGSDDWKVYAICATSGTQKWAFQTGGWFHAN